LNKIVGGDGVLGGQFLDISNEEAARSFAEIILRGTTVQAG
jgi:hypothetical protein